MRVPVLLRQIPPSRYGVLRLTGMCVCSAKNSASNPRSSTARAISAGCSVYSVMNVPIAKSVIQHLISRECAAAFSAEPGPIANSPATSARGRPLHCTAPDPNPAGAGQS